MGTRLNTNHASLYSEYLGTFTISNNCGRSNIARSHLSSIFKQLKNILHYSCQRIIISIDISIGSYLSGLDDCNRSSEAMRADST
jgi:hypothetical protein